MRFLKSSFMSKHFVHVYIKLTRAGFFLKDRLDFFRSDLSSNKVPQSIVRSLTRGRQKVTVTVFEDQFRFNNAWRQTGVICLETVLKVLHFTCNCIQNNNSSVHYYWRINARVTMETNQSFNCVYWPNVKALLKSFLSIWFW